MDPFAAHPSKESLAARDAPFDAAGDLPGGDLGSAAAGVARKIDGGRSNDHRLPDDRNDRWRRVHAVDDSPCRADIHLDDDVCVGDGSVPGRRQNSSVHRRVPVSAGRLHGAQRRLARQPVSGQSAGAVAARAPDRDHLAAAEGIPGQRQRLAMANRCAGQADRRARSFRRSGAAAATALEGRAVFRTAGNAVSRRHDHGIEHHRSHGTACAAARGQSACRRRRRDAAMVVDGKADGRQRRSVSRLSRLRPRRH